MRGERHKYHGRGGWGSQQGARTTGACLPHKPGKTKTHRMRKVKGIAAKFCAA